jgi:hypothetical protein
MNFEDWQRIWQAKEPRNLASIDADTLLKEIRAEQRRNKRSDFGSDLFIVVIVGCLVPYFWWGGHHQHNWGLQVMALCCLFIGGFILVDRWFQRRKQPVTTDTIAVCLESSLALVRHQIWRAKNIFWWYLLPFLAGFAAPSIAPLCDWLTGREQKTMALVKSLAFASVAVFGWLLCGYIYWANQHTLKKVLGPRLAELEQVQAQRLKELEELQANFEK